MVQNSKKSLADVMTELAQARKDIGRARGRNNMRPSAASKAAEPSRIATSTRALAHSVPGLPASRCGSLFLLVLTGGGGDDSAGQSCLPPLENRSCMPRRLGVSALGLSSRSRVLAMESQSTLAGGCHTLLIAGPSASSPLPQV